MESEYAIDIYKQLEDEFSKLSLHRPMHLDRYEDGTQLEYSVTELDNANRGTVRLLVEKFVGGGFAGQVYRVKITEILSEGDPVATLEVGGVYAMKILIPPSGFSLFFRNTLYWAGFQGPFQLQVNPAASRSGALWQKFIRRGARVRFGDENAVVDIHATFVDEKLGSCGELSEWVEGRTWRLEVNDRLDALKRWLKGKKVAEDTLGSPEYRAKHKFMHSFVELLHEMGAFEFARQYEWSTCKSQPNCLKRKSTGGSASDGLVAVDFRSGLALLPFLPMSPGDFKLIIKGLGRGSLVQFDRGDVAKLEQYMRLHPEPFEGTQGMLEELKSSERIYRDSVPDITHNHVRLFSSSRLWSTIFSSAITGWKVTNLIGARWQEKFRNSKGLCILFAILGFIPLIGRFFRRIWGQSYWRRHYGGMFTSSDYLGRALRAKAIEWTIGWLRAGRVDDDKALKISSQAWRCAYHLPLSILPAGLHRILSDWHHAKARLDFYLLRPVRLYFNSALREQWLRDMIQDGRDKQLLTDEDAQTIESQIKEPYIQKYLKSLAVHVCTLPVTQVVSLIVAIIYVVTHPEMPRGQAYAIGLGIIALFQVVPISPGSLVRGLYVLYLVIREKNFKDYNIAVFLGFFKYVGYLAFPIQMTYRYPALARFMAGHWATEAVHMVPVFGERGALLEHSVFNLFYNWPLTIRRKMRIRSQYRANLKPRYWHLIPCTIIAGGIFALTDLIYLGQTGSLSDLGRIWWLAVIVSLACGCAVTLGAGGAELWKRILGAGICGVVAGIGSVLVSSLLPAATTLDAGVMTITCIWRVFAFTILAIIGALIAEVRLPEPDTE